MKALIAALRAKKTIHVVAAVNATLAALVAFGVPLTPAQLASANTLVAAWLLVVAGAPQPGSDGDPETPQ